jgi:hypothetical protein
VSPTFHRELRGAKAMHGAKRRNATGLGAMSLMPDNIHNLTADLLPTCEVPCYHLIT